MCPSSILGLDVHLVRSRGRACLDFIFSQFEPRTSVYVLQTSTLRSLDLRKPKIKTTLAMRLTNTLDG